MFRRVLVGKLEGLLDILDLDDQTLLDGLPDDIHSGQRVGLTVDLLLDLLQQLGSEVDGDEDDLRVDPVLGLGEQVRGDKDRVGRLVGNDLRGVDVDISATAP